MAPSGAAADAPMASPACPCSSGRPLRTCCLPFIDGKAEPPTPTALMRSRYAAFALKGVDYLWRTLARDHEDRRRAEADVKRELRATATRFKYPGLTILDAQGEDPAAPARVLFHARVFEKGRDRSFIEASRFVFEDGGWRYLDGEFRPIPTEKEALAALRL